MRKGGRKQVKEERKEVGEERGEVKEEEKKEGRKVGWKRIEIFFSSLYILIKSVRS